MTNRKKIIVALSITAILGLIVSLNLNLQEVKGSAPSGYETFVATSSTITVANAARVAFATSTGCTSRVVTVLTQNTAVMAKFADHSSITLSATAGHRLANSSTTPITLDAGLYGCGQMTVFAESGTVTLQVSEFRGFR